MWNVVLNNASKIEIRFSDSIGVRRRRVLSACSHFCVYRWLWSHSWVKTLDSSNKFPAHRISHRNRMSQLNFAKLRFIFTRTQFFSNRIVDNQLVDIEHVYWSLRGLISIPKVSHTFVFLAFAYEKYVKKSQFWSQLKAKICHILDILAATKHEWFMKFSGCCFVSIDLWKGTNKLAWKCAVFIQNGDELEYKQRHKKCFRFSSQ